MNLEDLKTYMSYASKVKEILGRRIDPLGTEYDVLKDIVTEIKTMRMSNRDIELSGVKRAWESGVISGAVAYFREKVKKDIMPLQFAKDDNLIIQPLYKPQIFNMNSFTISWTGVTAPAYVDLLTPGGTPGPYSLNVDKEIIILTDIIALDPTPAITDIKITFDGEEQRPVVARKDWLATDLHIFELPFPVVADINIRIQGRTERAEGTFTYMPVGLHVALGSLTSTKS